MMAKTFVGRRIGGVAYRGCLELRIESHVPACCGWGHPRSAGSLRDCDPRFRLSLCDLDRQHFGRGHRLRRAVQLNSERAEGRDVNSAPDWLVAAQLILWKVSLFAS
jgi:hypothetical protein